MIRFSQTAAGAISRRSIQTAIARSPSASLSRSTKPASSRAYEMKTLIEALSLSLTCSIDELPRRAVAVGRPPAFDVDRDLVRHRHRRHAAAGRRRRAGHDAHAAADADARLVLTLLHQAGDL